MKKKIVYGLLTIILLSGLYYGLRFTFGFFTPFNSWTARQDIKNGKIQIADIGELPLNHRQKQSLANSYGFDFYYFGCNISTDIINGTKYYNKTMVDHLENKFGVGWWTKFQTQLDSIDTEDPIVVTMKRVLNLVARQKIVKDKIKLIDSLSNGRRQISMVSPVLEDELKNIWVVQVGELNDSAKLVTNYYFMVDANTMTIVNPSGKIEGQ